MVVPVTSLRHLSDHDLRVKWGTNIREARLAVGLEQAELAARLETYQQLVSSWERGLRVPKDSMRPRLAAVLGVAVNDLFTYEDVAA
jgi:ribosome-binding protein aMBF1 (putative translation factor)